VRKFNAPDESRHLSNELDAATVGGRETCEGSFTRWWRYYRMKKPYPWDTISSRITTVMRRSSIPRREVDYPQTCDLILNSLKGFGGDANSSGRVYDRPITSMPSRGRGKTGRSLLPFDARRTSTHIMMILSEPDGGRATRWPTSWGAGFMESCRGRRRR